MLSSSPLSSSPGLSLELNLGIEPLIPRRSRIARDTPVLDSPEFRPSRPINLSNSGDSLHPNVTISQYQQFQALYGTPTKNIEQSTNEMYFSQYAQPQTRSQSNLRVSQLPKKLEYLESQTEIDFDQLVFVNRLGEGAFGEVWRASLWDLDVAVKRLKGNFLRASPLEELADEVALLKSLRHPNCVLFLGFTKPPNFCIITEYLSLGSLRSLLDNPMVRLNSKIVVRIALAIARGMNYLHTQSPAIFHRDLNSHNILCNKNWTIKVADYGLSRTIDSSMEFCGAVPWQAPEVKSGLFLPESDVYSFGIVLWELLTRDLPWKGIDMQIVLQKTKNGERPQIPSDCPPVLSDLVKRCWNQEPLKRPSFHEIIEILKPFEKVKSAVNSPSVSKTEELPMESYLQEYEDIMMFGDSNSIVCRCWESFLDYNGTETGLEFVFHHTSAMETFISGSICLIDSWGKMIWIVGLNSRDALEEEEKYMKSQQEVLKEFSFSLVSPITRQTMKLTPFCLKPGATHATAVRIRIQEGLGSESLKLFKQNSMQMLQDFTTNWCGTIILTDCESTQVTIITLFNCPEAMEELESRGYLQKQMKAFQNLMADMPTFGKYNVKQNTFHMISPLEGLKSSSSSSIQSLPELGRHSNEDKKTVDFAKEPVLDSFFALLHYNTEVSVGHVFICAEHLRFKGRKSLSRSGERVVSLHLRDLVSMDENRPFGRTGHTLQLITSNGTILTLKSLLQREKLMRLIQQQVDKLQPAYHIIHLLNGESYS